MVYTVDIEFLSDLAKDIKYRTIGLNRGGCGIFAYHVAKYLQRYYPTRIALINMYKNGLSIDEIKPNINNKNDINEWYENGLDFHHVMVELDYPNGLTYLYDSNGLTDITFNLPYEFSGKLGGFLTPEELKPLISRSEGWNHEYNRKINTPIIKKITRSYFERKHLQSVL